MMTTDLSQDLPVLPLPVYFLEGVYDYTRSYTEALACFDRLQAPLKEFYTFENSAHGPMFEEPEKTLRIMRDDVLFSSVWTLGTSHLSDARMARPASHAVIDVMPRCGKRVSKNV
jgi:hypothetical protein